MPFTHSYKEQVIWDDGNMGTAIATCKVSLDLIVYVFTLRFIIYSFLIYDASYRKKYEN